MKTQSVRYYVFAMLALTCLAPILSLASPVRLPGVPTSIAEEDDVYYVACKSLDQSPTGCIAILNQRGRLISANAFPNVVLNVPTSVCIDDDVLYVADGARVIGINLKARVQVFAIDLSKTGATSVADIVEKDDLLYVSTPNIQSIFSINPRMGTYAKIPLKQPLNQPYALDVKDGLLYVAERATDASGKPAGRIVSLPLMGNMVRPVTVVYAGPGVFTGLAVDDEDRFFSSHDDTVVYFCNQSDGHVSQLNLRTQKVKTLTRAPLKTSVDFIVEDDRVILPSMDESRLMCL